MSPIDPPEPTSPPEPAPPAAEWKSPRAFGVPEGPIQSLLGLEMLAGGPAGTTLRLPARREFLQEGGVFQGGILAALADACAVYALLPDLPAGRSITSIEFKVNFLRPARLEDGPVVARSQILRSGRTIALARVRLEQAGEQVLEGLFTYLYLDAD